MVILTFLFLLILGMISSPSRRTLTETRSVLSSRSTRRKFFAVFTRGLNRLVLAIHWDWHRFPALKKVTKTPFWPIFSNGLRTLHIRGMFVEFAGGTNQQFQVSDKFSRT